MKLFFNVVILCLAFLQAFSQSYIKGIYISPAYGFFWAHTEKVNNISDHAKKIDVGLLFQTTGKKIWQIKHDYPTLSVNFSYAKASYNNMLGNIYGLGINYNRTLWQKNNIKQFLRIGSGLGYVQNVFKVDPVYNKIVVLSTHVNGILTLGTVLSFTIKNRLVNNIYLGLYHQSNGSFRKPNFGINYVHIAFESGFYFRKITKQNPVDVNNHRENNLWLSARIAGGVKQKTIFVRQYLVNTFSVGLTKTHSDVLDWTLGIDVFHDPTLRYEVFDFYNIYPGQFRSSVRGGSKYHIGKVYLLGELGLYFYNPEAGSKSLIYQRIGIAYKISKRFSTGVFLKAHFATAEFIEFSLNGNIFKIK